MKTEKPAFVYILGTIIQIFTLCVIAFILRLNKTEYSKSLDTIFMILGGISSALWGIIVFIKYIAKKKLYGV